MSLVISRLENGEITLEKCENVNFDLHYDIICVGAGSGGIYAADAASTLGAKVLLIENDEFIGGTHLLGNVGGYYYGFSGGSYTEDDDMSKDDRLLSVVTRYQQKQKRQQNRLVRDGVDLRTRHTPTAIILDGDRVAGLMIFDGHRELYAACKTVIDATADGHILRMCNIPKMYADKNGVRAPFTVRARYIKDGKSMVNNRDAGPIDQYDGRDFSAKAIRARAECSFAGDPRQLIDMPLHVGVREGLSFTGVDCLTTHDVLLGKAPSRVLFYAYSDLDRHGRDRSMADEVVQDWCLISNLSTVTVRVPVPLGAVAVRDIRGLVTAGRCICADPNMQGTVRMVRDMQRMGECVGVAAAISISDGCDFCDVDYGKYLAEVERRGCFAGDPTRRFGFDYPNKPGRYTPIDFTTKKTLHLLKTETPGPAIWSCYLERDSKPLAKHLISELSATDDTLYKYNLAIALGIIGNSAALPTLREIVANRDCFYFKDCRRTNQFRTVVAVCLLGRLGTPDDIPVLESLALDPDEATREMYHTLPPDYLYCSNQRLNFLYYDVFTNAAVALAKISRRYDLDSSSLNAKFTEFRDTGAIISRLFGDPDARGSEVDPILRELDSLLNNLIEMTK